MKKTIKITVSVILALISIAVALNCYVVLTTKDDILSPDGLAEKSGFDCIIILGAGVNGDTPSAILEDRLKTGIELYKQGTAPKIIMTGDHGKTQYDEVNAMKDYAIKQGVRSEDVFMDHAGFSTYESIFRAKAIFGAEKVVIVSQKYHLYRALYIAERLGIEAYGVEADLQKYKKEFYRQAREFLARDKDLIKCIFKPDPTYLGDEIPVSGNGDVTNDKG